jgi:hypothetical protein
MSAQDPELGRTTHGGSESATVGDCNGFIAVSNQIASDPDKRRTICRRFDALSARNLLFYQAELAELEVNRRNTMTKTARLGHENIDRP